MKMARCLCFVIILATVTALSRGDEMTRREESIVRSMLDNYSEDKRHVRPATNTTVEFGMTLAGIEDLDSRTGALKAVGWIKMKWTDLRLAWSDASVSQVSFPIDRLWRPDIEIFNGLHYQQPINTDVYPLVFSNGQVLWIPPFSLAVQCVPSEDSSWQWDCSPKFGSWVHNAHQIVLKEYEGQKKVVLDQEIVFPGWEVEAPEGRGVESRFYDCCPDQPYASIKFLIRIRRAPGWSSGAATVSVHYLWCSLVMLLATSLY